MNRYFYEDKDDEVIRDFYGANPSSSSLGRRNTEAENPPISSQVTCESQSSLNHMYAAEYLTLEGPQYYKLKENNQNSLATEDVPELYDQGFARAENSNDFRWYAMKYLEDDHQEEEDHQDENNIETRRRKRRRRRRNSISSLPVSTVSVFSAVARKHETHEIPPKRTTLQLVLNSLIMFGREFCYAVEGGLTTPILLSIGLPLHMYSLVWVISPILGFILQPILGILSDRCTCSWGKRRPFILGLAILLLLGMTLFLNGEHIISTFVSRESERRSFANNRSTVAAIIVTIVGVVLFDFSADFIEGPIRAYAMDVFDEVDVKKSLLLQAIFTGAGGAFGYASGGVAWTRDTPLRQLFPSDRQVVYAASSFIFIFCCICNLLSIREGEQERPQLKVNSNTGNALLVEEENPESRIQGSEDEEGGCEIKRIPNTMNPFEPLLKENVNHTWQKKNPERNYSLKCNQAKHKELMSLGIRERKPEKVKLKKSKRKHNTRNVVKKKSKKMHRKSLKRKRVFPSGNQPFQLNSYGTFKWHSQEQDDLKEEQTQKDHPWPSMRGGLSNAVECTDQKAWKHNEYKLKTSYKNEHQMEAKRKLLKNNDIDDSDQDSIDSFSTSFGFMLERYFPYAAVDPAFKHIRFQSKNDEVEPRTSKHLVESKRKIFPEHFENETTFSESITYVSEHFKLDHENGEKNNPPKIVEVGGIKSLYLSIKTMPRELRMLCICQLLGWISFLSIALFFTDFVGQVVMKGDPRAAGSRQSRLYDRGVEIGNWGLTINAAVSCLYCVLLKTLISRLGFRAMYVFGHILYASGACFIALFPSVTVVLSLSSVIGVMSATLYTIPYMLVAQYHDEYKNNSEIGLSRGVGVDCALVTCMIQLAQIVTGLGIGALVNWSGTVTVTIVVASVFGFLGTLWAGFLVKY